MQTFILFARYVCAGQAGQENTPVVLGVPSGRIDSEIDEMLPGIHRERLNLER